MNNKKYKDHLILCVRSIARFDYIKAELMLYVICSKFLTGLYSW